MGRLVLCILWLLTVVHVWGEIMITRHYQGDLFGATELNCTEEDCAVGGRGASRLPWLPCMCQCMPATPVFRQDRGDCVDRIEECMQAVFIGPMTLERIPLVFPPIIKDHPIHISSEITLSGDDFPPSSSKPNCNIRGVNFMTSNGWQAFHRGDSSVFYLSVQDSQWFVKFSGDVDLGSSLDGHLVLLNVSCGELDSSGVQQGALAPCIVFRMAGSPGPQTSLLSATPTSTSRGSDYAVMALCIGLLGLTYVLAVLVYLIVRRQRQAKKKRLEEEESESGDSEIREESQGDDSHASSELSVAKQRRDEKLQSSLKRKNPQHPSFGYRNEFTPQKLTVIGETSSNGAGEGVDNPNLTNWDNSDSFTVWDAEPRVNSQGNNLTNPWRNDKPTPLARIPEEGELRDQNDGKYDFISFCKSMQKRRVHFNRHRNISEDDTYVEEPESNDESLENCLVLRQNNIDEVPISRKQLLNRIYESEDGFESDSLERPASESSCRLSSGSSRNMDSTTEQNISAIKQNRTIYKSNRNGANGGRKAQRSESVYLKSLTANGNRARHKTGRKLRLRSSSSRPKWLRAVRLSVNRFYKYVRGEEGENSSSASTSRSPHPIRAAFVKKCQRRQRRSSHPIEVTEVSDETKDSLNVGWKKERTPPDGSASVKETCLDNNNSGTSENQIVVNGKPNGVVEQPVETIDEMPNNSLKSSLRQTLDLVKSNVENHHVSQPKGYTELVQSTSSLDETFCDSLEPSPILDRKPEVQEVQ